MRVSVQYIFMRTNLLATKLFVPPNRVSWVSRPRLLQKLSNGFDMGSKLTMVSAPAGFGKTTLVTAWADTLRASSRGVKIAWLSLDSGDNDLAVFMSYVVAALRTCDPRIGEITEHLLEQSPLPGPEALLLPLVNDLAQIDGKIILALDDYHIIQLPAIHEALALLIERQPPEMQVVITTRQDPLLPLARWRARGLLTEIRLKELRFTAEETAEFLNRATGLAFHADDISALENRTEGWIAGLQLAAISLAQSGADHGDGAISAFIQNFTGDDRFVMDYLLEEVLSRQPAPVQRFLMRTSVLERLTVSLCEALLEDGGEALPALSREGFSAAAILAYLDQANLFLIPLDHRRQWYRYHHLFSELLQHRLRSDGGKELTDHLKCSASRWFDANGFADEAIRYAQSAGNWDLSSLLIEKHAPPLMQRGEQTTVLRWLNAMPDQVIRQNGHLCRYYGYILTVTGKLDLGALYLEHAETAFPNDADHLGSTLAFASYNACFRGEFAREIELARRALSLLSPNDQWMRGLAAISLGLGLCHTGDPQGCEAAMKEALAAGERVRSVRTCVHALTYLGRISVLRLDFAQAEAYFRRAITYQIDGQVFAGIDIPLLDLAQLKYEQNELDQAMAYLEQGMETNRRSGGIEMRAYAYRIAARLHQLRGNSQQAQDYLAQALQLAREYNLSPLTLSLNAACQVEMALAEGNLHEARLAAVNIVNSLGLFTFNFYPEMARVRVLLAQGNKREALSELEPALWRAGQPGWEYPRLQVRVLQALIAADPGKARQLMLEALELAERGGAVRSIVDLGAPVQELLLALRPSLKATESAYTDTLLSILRHEIGSVGPSAGQPLVEPLSEREIEVLRLLADGLSNLEIAQRLFLSPNTLKAHTQNIYSKLDVHSRVQAVNKARELGLLNAL